MHALVAVVPHRARTLLDASHLIRVKKGGIWGLAEVSWMLQAMPSATRRHRLAEGEHVHGQNVAFVDPLCLLVGQPRYAPCEFSTKPNRTGASWEVLVPSSTPRAAWRATDYDVYQALASESVQRMERVRVRQIPGGVDQEVHAKHQHLELVVTGELHHVLFNVV